MKGLGLEVVVQLRLEEEDNQCGLIVSVVVAQARQCNEPLKYSPLMYYKSRLFYVDFYRVVLCPDRPFQPAKLEQKSLPGADCRLFHSNNT